MDLNKFMNSGINGVMKAVGRFYLGNRPGRAFLARILPQIKRAARLREQSERAGVHVPALLIASVASRCNLHCAGCYAWAGGACGKTAEPDLPAGEWARIFEEASSLGVSFLLLAGGEPLLRRDVMAAAARQGKLVFPVFTNGTLVDDAYLALFDEHRHLIPILSIEGGREDTDARRGQGTAAAIDAAMAGLQARRILFGASVTVTRENLNTVLAPSFVRALRDKGCGAVFFVEYVPAEPGTEHLTLTEEETAALNSAAHALEASLPDMVILSFPGDEAAMGGCLASGRGFFHINPSGGAEPCPFCPHARHNVTDTSLREILASHYFESVRAIAAAAGPHAGGCVLFHKEKEIKALLEQ